MSAADGSAQSAPETVREVSARRWSTWALAEWMAGLSREFGSDLVPGSAEEIMASARSQIAADLRELERFRELTGRVAAEGGCLTSRHVAVVGEVFNG